MSAATSKKNSYCDRSEPRALPTTAQDSYSRLPAQLEQGPAIEADEQVALLRSAIRRKAGGLSRIETVTAIILIESADREGGRLDLNVMAIRKRAGCDRRSIFRALEALEELALIERETILPDFAACTHTELAGWAGFHACTHHRDENGIMRGCVAHHGRTVIRWRCVTVDELAARLPAEQKRHRRRGAYVTPIRVTRKPRSEGAYVTPNPGPLQITETNAPPPLSERARGDTSEHAVRALPARFADAAPAFGGFANTQRSTKLESESTGGVGARVVPSAPPSADEAAVLADYRERFRASSPPLVRDLLAIAAALARGWTRAELAEAFAGAASSAYNLAPGRSSAAWILANDERIGALIGVARSAMRADGRMKRRHGPDYPLPFAAPDEPPLPREELARLSASVADAISRGGA